jgi:hypothetical protein
MVLDRKVPGGTHSIFADFWCGDRINKAGQLPKDASLRYLTSAIKQGIYCGFGQGNSSLGVPTGGLR